MTQEVSLGKGETSILGGGNAPPCMNVYVSEKSRELRTHTDSGGKR